MASGKSAGAGALSSVTEISLKPTLEMPPHAIAGLTGELAQKFESQNKVPLVQPVAHVWTTKGLGNAYIFVCFVFVFVFSSILHQRVFIHFIFSVL